MQDGRNYEVLLLFIIMERSVATTQSAYHHVRRGTKPVARAVLGSCVIDLI